jgi:hypothetical protein
MSNKKQSSIDKFVKQLKRKGLLLTEDSEYIVAYLEAKAMHKEEQISFAKKCLDKALDLDVRTAHLKVEEMYNETFGGNNETH